VALPSPRELSTANCQNENLFSFGRSKFSIYFLPSALAFKSNDSSRLDIDKDVYSHEKRAKGFGSGMENPHPKNSTSNFIDFCHFLTNL
jgi:hypothetical protein